MGEVTRVDKQRRCVLVDFFDRVDVPVSYDYLILATGVHHSYFGRDEFERFAPGLKSLADAVAIRRKILTAFEQAETMDDPNADGGLMTFVIVGAGPTGVELAAAIATFVSHTVESEFRRIHPRSTKVVLVAPHVLATFCDKLSGAAYRRLIELGVDVRLGARVEVVDEHGVILGNGERILAGAVFWAAGVEPSPAGKWLDAETDRAGRVRVRPDLTVAGNSEIFVIGDTASLDQDGGPLPGVAQVAIQQGNHAGKQIERLVAGASTTVPFRHVDKGSMAIVGPHFAVLQTPRFQMSGFVAWLGWLLVHLQFLAQPRLRLKVFTQWMWVYLTGQRGSRLVVNHFCNEGSCREDPDICVVRRER
jgi:NADH dehydrogenase FAD-containing subunit